jgi:hypothetical protein
MALGCVRGGALLQHGGSAAANKRGARALRPTVIARKVPHCSKNPRGAEAFATSVSVLRTEAQTGVASTIDE